MPKPSTARDRSGGPGQPGTIAKSGGTPSRFLANGAGEWRADAILYLVRQPPTSRKRKAVQENRRPQGAQVKRSAEPGKGKPGE